jgi:hypothetical protein
MGKAKMAWVSAAAIERQGSFSRYQCVETHARPDLGVKFLPDLHR